MRITKSILLEEIKKEMDRITIKNKFEHKLELDRIKALCFDGKLFIPTEKQVKKVQLEKFYEMLINLISDLKLDVDVKEDNKVIAYGEEVTEIEILKDGNDCVYQLNNGVWTIKYDGEFKFNHNEMMALLEKRLKYYECILKVRLNNNWYEPITVVKMFNFEY